MGPEGKKRDGFVRVRGLDALIIDGGIGRKALAFPLELLDPSHGYDRGGPVHDYGEPDCIDRGQPPGMRVGSEGGGFAPERNDLGQGGSAIGVGIIALGGGFHDVASAPQVVEGVVDHDGSGSVLVGHLHARIDGVEGNGLSDLEVGVPVLAGVEPGFLDLDPGARFASADRRAEEFVEVESLEGIVRPHPVAGGESGEFGYCGGFLGVETAVGEDGLDQLVVKGFGYDEKAVFHGFFVYSPGNSLAWARAGSPLRTLMRFRVAMVACRTTDS